MRGEGSIWVCGDRIIDILLFIHYSSWFYLSLLYTVSTLFLLIFSSFNHNRNHNYNSTQPLAALYTLEKKPSSSTLVKRKGFSSPRKRSTISL